MSLFDKAYSYFRELSAIPRPSRKEEKVRKWLISWAKSHNWNYQEDKIGNLLVFATSLDAKRWTQNALCLQSHMDMVCVTDHVHDFSEKGIEIIDDGEIIRGNGTTLGADNGIGVAVMMAIAEMENRPDLELLFTMGEEIGLIGAHHIELPITAKHALNLDWCHSKNIGIGCGGTLLMEASSEMQKEELSQTPPSEGGAEQKEGKRGCEVSCYKIDLRGLTGGHSGIDILENQGNAIIELCKIISDDARIAGVSEMIGGDADNAIPRNASVEILWNDSEENLNSFLLEKKDEIQGRITAPEMILKFEKYQIPPDKGGGRRLGGGELYDKKILATIGNLSSGVQEYQDNGLPLSSWNLGKIIIDKSPCQGGEDKELKKGGLLRWCYFLRTNKIGGIEPMKNNIQKTFIDEPVPLEFIRRGERGEENGCKIGGIRAVNFSLSHESPVWFADPHSPFVQSILQVLNTTTSVLPLPSSHLPRIEAITTHATMESGTLAEKYPNTEWVSLGATCHDMHTTREHIYLSDFEEFCVRLEKIVTNNCTF